MSVCFFEHLVRGDDEHRCGGLEAHAALDADDRVADVHVAADAVLRADGLHGADRLDLVGVGLAVDGGDLTRSKAMRGVRGSCSVTCEG